MSVRLSPALYKKLAAEGTSTGMMPGEAADKWLERIQTEYQGKYNPPADMSLLSDKEILDAVSTWVSKQSYSDRQTDKTIIQRRDSLILIPGGVSPYHNSTQRDLRVKFPWLKLVPVMHFIHKLLVLRLVADVGKKDPKVILGHRIDPRRNRHWGNWAIGHCQYGFPTVTSHNGDSIYPKKLRIREVMRPILSVNSTDSDKVMWLANSDIGLVCLDWTWWAWEEKNPFNLEVCYIPYGPLMTLRGETRVLKDENPYSVGKHYEGQCQVITTKGYHNPISFEELSLWQNRVYKEFYATAEVSSNCLSYNPQWDADVADDQVKDPVKHGAPIKNQQKAWDDLARRFELLINKQYSAAMCGKAEWEAYWAARYKERNKI